MSFSSILAVLHRRLIGRQFLPCEVSLPGLGSGMMMDFFQMLGMMDVLMEMLYMCVRYVSAFVSRCLRWRMLSESGPMALDDLEVRIACLTSFTVYVVVSLSLRFVVLCLLMRRRCVSVFLLALGTYCVAN